MPSTPRGVGVGGAGLRAGLTPHLHPRTHAHATAAGLGRDDGRAAAGAGGGDGSSQRAQPSKWCGGRPNRAADRAEFCHPERVPRQHVRLQGASEGRGRAAAVRRQSSSEAGGRRRCLRSLTSRRAPLPPPHPHTRTLFQVHENTQLLVQFRDNILAIINHMEAMGGVMGQMPQLPVRCVACLRRPLAMAPSKSLRRLSPWRLRGLSSAGSPGAPTLTALPACSFRSRRRSLNVDLANNFLPSRPAGAPMMGNSMLLAPPPQPALAPGMVPLGAFAPGSHSVPQPAGGSAAGGTPPAGMIPTSQPLGAAPAPGGNGAGAYGSGQLGGYNPLQPSNPVIMKSEG